MMAEMSFPSQFKKEMSKLQEAYLARLKAAAEEMQRARETLSQAQTPRREAQSLYNLAHRLAESGAAFGYPELSKASRDLYLALDPLLNPAAAAAGADMSAFRAEALSRLSICERACQEAAGRKPHEAAEMMDVPEAAPLKISQGEEDIYVVAGGPDRAVAEAMAAEIAQFGYNAYVVTDPAAFRDVFAQGHMKAAVVFSEMAERDCAYLKDLCRTNAFVPMVVVSPYDDFEARIRAARAGAQGYFSGRVEVIRIVDKIERLSEQYAAAPDCHVLIVDDDEMLSEFYRAALSRAGLQVSVIGDPRQVTGFLSSNEVNLVLIDSVMPGCSGRDLAAVIRQHEEHTGVPIVFLSPQEEIDAMMGGAGPGIDDYIARPFTAQQLLSVVRSRARRAAETRSLLVHDTFTRLYNHEHFTEMLSQEIMRTKRTGALACYAIMDIDHFKQINSSYGHHAGDQVIKMMAHMLRHHLRRTDIVGRCGGEAFGVVMPGCPLKAAQESLEKFRGKVTASFFSVGAQKIRVTISVGVTLIDGKSGVDDVIKSADQALYAAKERGRNQIVAAT